MKSAGSQVPAVAMGQHPGRGDSCTHHMSLQLGEGSAENVLVMGLEPWHFWESRDEA